MGAGRGAGAGPRATGTEEVAQSGEKQGIGEMRRDAYASKSRAGEKRETEGNRTEKLAEERREARLVGPRNEQAVEISEPERGRERERERETVRRLES